MIGGAYANVGHVSAGAPGTLTKLGQALAVLEGLRSLLADSPLPYFETDSQGRVTHWNQRATEALGVSVGAALGRDLEAVVAEEDSFM